MNDILRYRFPDFLSYRDLVNFSLVDKETYNLMNNVLKQKKLEIIDKINNTFPNRIVDMVGRNNLLLAEKLEWDDKWLGNTDYIDRVVFDDLSNTFSYGVDRYRRPFIFVRMRRLKNNNNFIIVIFQRYTDGGTYVAIDPLNGIHHSIKEGYVAINKDFQKILSNLIGGKYSDYELV